MKLSASALAVPCINTLRFVSVDAVQKSNSGHPGLPLGAAPLTDALWTEFLKHNPVDPGWFARDRFVLSAGHRSMLLYSLLHMTGYALSLEQLKQLRQWGSLTPGHPERRLTPGVEVTTGPLGQRFGNGVGMPIAEAHLAARYNRAGFDVIDHFTYGWHTQSLDDGNDVDAIARALRLARAETSRPSPILVSTHLGYGSPGKQETFEAHGSPLGEGEVSATKRHLGWPAKPAFFIPDAALAHFRKAVERDAQVHTGWNDRFVAYALLFPKLARELERVIRGDMAQDWHADIPVFPADAKGMATRVASGKVMNAIAPRLPAFIGGSAPGDVYAARTRLHRRQRLCWGRRGAARAPRVKPLVIAPSILRSKTLCLRP